MMNRAIYQEKISSRGTTTLFFTLALVFLVLAAWRFALAGPEGPAIAFLCLFALFLFFTLNYRVLSIRISSRSVRLKFGIFSWRIPMDNIQTCYPDQASLWRIGGAGMHFTFIRWKYRAYFNFLEHQRVVLTLARKKGLVREIAFSTTRLDEVIRVIKRP